MTATETEKNQAEQTQKSGTTFNLVRILLILLLVGFLVWSVGKKNPKIRAFFDRFTAAQKAVDPNAVLSISGESMGTFWNVKVAGPPKGCDQSTVRERVTETLDRIDRLMSTYKDDSEISRFNASDSTDWFAVSAETAKVVALAQKISEVTGGAFDITVGPLVELWRFGPNKTPLTDFPSDALIEETRGRCGYDKLEARTEPEAALRKSVPDLRLDLSAVAKGYVVDALAEALKAEEINNYMIDVGGEVRCAGSKGEKPWTLGIEKPIPSRDAPPEIYRFVRPGSLALATSGGGRNFSVLRQKRFSHLIDPRTGRPTEIESAETPGADYERGSVSVFDPSCAVADALATGLYILGPEEGKKLADAQGWPVLFVSRSRQDAELFSETASESFGTVDSFLPGEK